MNSRALIDRAARQLTRAGVADARVDASLLLERVTGIPPLSLRMGCEVDDAAEQPFLMLLERRLAREPLQYILGDQPFCGRIFRVDSRVLIPRPETELLAELAIDWLRHSGKASPRVLDLCCGSGCIGLTAALECPDARVTLADLSDDALAVARANAETLGAAADIRQSDLFDALTGPWDLIVSNPPYIPTADCGALQTEVLREPMLALDGGADGLTLYRRIAAQAKSRLTEGGRLML